MKKTIFLLTIVTFFYACQSTPSNNQNQVSVDEDFVIKLKLETIPKAYEEQDTVVLNSLLHEQYRLIDDEGSIFTKADEIGYAANYPPSYSSFQYSLDHSAVLPNGTVLLFGTNTLKGTDNQGVYITKYKSSDVFVMTASGWQTISTHVSGVTEERFENAPE